LSIWWKTFGDLRHEKKARFTAQSGEDYILPFIIRFQYIQGRPYFFKIQAG